MEKIKKAYIKFLKYIKSSKYVIKGVSNYMNI